MPALSSKAALATPRQNHTLAPPGPGPCAVNNGGCSALAVCSGELSNEPTCTCQAWRAGAGDACNGTGACFRKGGF